MGAYSGPDISEQGLVLALDAANRKNYNLTAVEVLVVAGGGGGGAGTAGGGGGGGLIYNNNFAVTPGSALTVTVGAGGSGKVYSVSNSAGDNGGNSVFGSLTAIGGGGGGNRDSGEVGKNGGSGGGGGGSEGGINGAGTGTSGQGFAGGVGRGGGVGSAGGGGGGAGGVGQASPSTGLGGNGGPGLGFDISGTFTYYGGGGGGGSHTGRSSGGIGGGGAGSQNGPTYNAVAGTTNTGGGGGGGGGAAGGQYGGNGGSGIVIVRYPGPQKAIGGTVTSVGGYIIHTFTTTGSTTFTPLSATNNSAILGLSDFSGRDNFATSVNGVVYSSANGGSLSFDGSNDNVTTGKVLVPRTGQFHIEGWCYLNQTNAICMFVTQYNNGADAGRFQCFFASDGTIRMHDGGGVMTGTTPSYSANQWFYVSFQRDSSNLCNIFVNGTKETTGGTKTTTLENTNTIIGSRGSIPGGTFYNGRMSNVRIYNRALSASEIQQNFNATRGRFGI